jgi:hypothetical protein
MVNLKGASLIRFLTPTEGWDERAGDGLCVPYLWKLMLVELLFDEQGELLLSTATGVARNSVKAFRIQGIPFHAYSDLPDYVVAALQKHFQDDARDLLKRLKALSRQPTKSHFVVIR